MIYDCNPISEWLVWLQVFLHLRFGLWTAMEHKFWEHICVYPLALTFLLLLLSWLLYTASKLEWYRPMWIVISWLICFFIRFDIAFLSFCFMCSFKFSDWSKYPPKYITMWLIGIRNSIGIEGFCWYFSSCLLDQKSMYSVLSEFNFKCMVSIQLLMWTNDVSNSFFVPGFASFVTLFEFFS